MLDDLKDVETEKIPVSIDKKIIKKIKNQRKRNIYGKFQNSCFLSFPPMKELAHRQRYLRHSDRQNEIAKANPVIRTIAAKSGQPPVTMSSVLLKMVITTVRTF